MRPLSIYLPILITAFIFFGASAHAKTLGDLNKVEAASDLFMSQIMAGEVSSAFSLISAYLAVEPTAFAESGKKAELALNQLNTKMGKPLSYSLLKKQSVGEHFHKLTYLLKYQSVAIVWEINYYQPSEGWKLIDINSNTNINDLFN